MEDPVTSGPKRVVGYLAGWSTDERFFSALDHAADNLTHINYAFGLIGPDGRVALGDPDADTARPYPEDEGGHEGLRGNFRQLQLLKARHPHLRTLISMG
ncbi:MAG TPA: glycosyl hydrolase family 18 protein, partial [Thermomicrobiales bacterium]|nr:glycosyl hydrolase family 18 protein [Thermomicrobiales bacterium]